MGFLAMASSFFLFSAAPKGSRSLNWLHAGHKTWQLRVDTVQQRGLALTIILRPRLTWDNHLSIALFCHGIGVVPAAGGRLCVPPESFTLPVYVVPHPTPGDSHPGECLGGVVHLETISWLVVPSISTILFYIPPTSHLKGVQHCFIL
jgi:hypothetical protein